MTRLCLIADAHVANHKRWGGALEGGLNVRGRECVDTLRRASLKAAAEKCDALFVLGDLFDATRPSPSLVAETINALTAGMIPVHVLLGNHDRQSQHPNDQACASMDCVDGITVHSSSTTVLFQNLNVVVVPYQPGEAKDWLAHDLAEQAVRLDRRVKTVVLTHLGIWDDETPSYLKAAKDAVGLGQVRWLMDAHGVEAVFAGNWHQHKSWTSKLVERNQAGLYTIFIPGTVCPASFSDPFEMGRVMYYDHYNGTVAGSVLSPTFQKADSVELLRVFLALKPSSAGLVTGGGSMPRSYVRCAVGRDQLAAALAVRAELAVAQPNMVVHVEARDAEAKESVREAARSVVTAGASLSAFIALADVAEPGTSEGVARRLVEYRKAAG